MIAGFVGVHRESGLRRGASWRTPLDTSTTDPPSPNALRHTTPLGCAEPGAHRVDLAPGNDIEQLSAFHVDDLRGSTLAPVRAFTLVKRLVQPDRCDHREPGGITCQHLPEQDNSLRHCVPNQPQVRCDFRHRPPGFCRPGLSPTWPPASSTRTVPKGSSSPVRCTSPPHTPGSDNAAVACATPAVPDARTPAINQQDLTLTVIMIPRRRRAPRPLPTRRPRVNLNPRPRRPPTQTDRHVRQNNKQRGSCGWRWPMGPSQGIRSAPKSGRRRSWYTAMTTSCPAVTR